MSAAGAERGPRWPALLEVAVVTAAVVTIYKALKLVEPAGVNFAPGVVMAAAVGALVRPPEVDAAAFRIGAGGWREGVAIGALASVAVLLAWALAILLLPAASPSGGARGVAFALATLAAALAGAAGRERVARHLPPAAGLAVAGGIVAVAFVSGLALGSGAGVALIAIAWRVTGAGIGEELFFRGYVQARTNVALGRPWRVLGVPFGPGLVVTAVLFAGVHLVNPAQPFAGTQELSWTWGAAALASGLLFGLLREATGSVWAGVLVHATSAVLGGVR